MEWSAAPADRPTINSFFLSGITTVEGLNAGIEHAPASLQPCANTNVGCETRIKRAGRRWYRFIACKTT
jgi:hypothetical protein